MEFKGNQITIDVPKGLSNKQKLLLKKLLEEKAFGSAFNYISSFTGQRNAGRNVCDAIRYAKGKMEADGHDSLAGKSKNTILTMFHRKTDIFGNAPMPINVEQGKALGIEIECFIPMSEKNIKEYFRALKIPGVKATHDGSIRVPESESEQCEYCCGGQVTDFDDDGNELDTTHDCGECDGSGFSGNSSFTAIEFRVLTSIDDMSNLETLCKALRDIDADVNKSCGLHVHLDMRGYRSLPKAILRRLVSALPMLKGMLPKSRMDNQYCREDVSSRNSRYAKINTQSFSKHRTIEVRMHSGSVNFEKISNWAKVLHSIAFSRARIEVPLTENLNEFSAYYARKLHWTESLLAYVNERLRNFNRETSNQEMAA